jgi:integrase-like protein
MRPLGKTGICLTSDSVVSYVRFRTDCVVTLLTIRRECLDWMIPLSEAHLWSILKSWVQHYDRGRPHSSLGPGVPDPPRGVAVVPKSESRHRLAAGALVLAKWVLGGLHYEYSLASTPVIAHQFVGKSTVQCATSIIAPTNSRIARLARSGRCVIVPCPRTRQS